MGISFDSWTISELDHYRTATKGEDVKSLELPSFQRTVVWSEDKRVELIRSIKREYPIGTFLLHEQPLGANADGDLCKNYLLVDGLQRTQAIAAYRERPLYYMPAAALTGSLMTQYQALIHAFSPNTAITAEECVEMLEKWMRDVKVTNQAAGFDAVSLHEYCGEWLDQNRSERTVALDSGLRLQAGQFLDDLSKACSIDAYKVPVLVYSGSAGDLPAIFYNLNKRGTQLSKYEILGAFWHDDRIDVKNSAIQKAVNDRYLKIEEESGVRISGFPPTGKISDFNLFEYLFGLGKVLSVEYPTLFPSSGDAGDPEAIGFTIAALTHGLELSKMEKDLPLRMRRHTLPTGEIDPSKFEQAVEKCCQKLNELLSPVYFQVKNNRGMNAILHTEYQVASMIGILLATRYDPATWSEIRGWRSNWSTLEVTLRQHYLSDLVLDAWRGSGDSKMFQRVWDSSTSSDYYLKPITKKNFTLQMNSWFEASLGVADTTRSPFSKATKGVIRFALWEKISHAVVKTDELQIDHMFPVARLTAIAGKPGWPINTVGNLCLLQSTLNGMKKKQTYAEYYDQVDAKWATMSSEEQSRMKASSSAKQKYRVPANVDKHIKVVLFLPKTELLSAFAIPTKNGKDALTQPNFEKAVRKNYSKMLSAIVDSLQLQ